MYCGNNWKSLICGHLVNRRHLMVYGGVSVYDKFYCTVFVHSFGHYSMSTRSPSLIKLHSVDKKYIFLLCWVLVTEMFEIYFAKVLDTRNRYDAEAKDNKYNCHKKVFLRDRKRHTGGGVACPGQGVARVSGGQESCPVWGWPPVRTWGRTSDRTGRHPSVSTPTPPPSHNKIPYVLPVKVRTKFTFPCAVTTL